MACKTYKLKRRITDGERARIRAMHREGFPRTAIKSRFSLSDRSVQRIIDGEDLVEVRPLPGR